MVYSAEIRWFFKNQAEVAVLEQWFNSRHLVFAGNWDRADIYLHQPDLQKLGVKIREGKVEIKALTTNRGTCELPNQNAGLLNEWVKYSFNLPDSDEESTALLQQFGPDKIKTSSDLWVRVDKERLLQKYAINTQQAAIMPIAADMWPPEGCGVELTKVKINQQTYYTFGFEAFSQSRQETANLKLVLAKLLPEMQVTHLQTDHSFSYPEFLNKLITNN